MVTQTVAKIKEIIMVLSMEIKTMEMQMVTKTVVKISAI
jgi:hypothetical protein